VESYPSKILLFGEYSILLGSDALAIPFDRFRGEWAFMEQQTAESRLSTAGLSNTNLIKFLDYLKHPGTIEDLLYFPDTNLFETDLKRGLYFNSNIPESSGFGASGALVAAVLKRYGTAEPGDIETGEIRKSLARLESYFHGTSSGIDPLVSYYGLPVYVKGNQKAEFADISASAVSNKYGLFIVQGDRLGSTEHLVKKFKMVGSTDKNYIKQIHKEYIPINNKCIDNVLIGKPFATLFSNLSRLIPLQTRFFGGMIGERMIPLMEYGIKHNLFGIKLCGSGGGGYMLGYTENPESTQKFFKEKQCEALFC
jgi:mevalonate kinase